MKKLAIILALSGLLFASCGNKAKQNQTQNKEATHTHEDGTCHDDHEHGAAAKQESFEVSDSTHTCATDSTKHDHKHSHDHGHDHKH